MFFCLSSGGYNKIPYTGWLKQWIFILPQFWRLEVQDQGADKIAFWWRLSSWLAEDPLLATCSQDLFCCACPHQRWGRGQKGKLSDVSSSKSSNPTGPRPCPHDLISLHLPKAPSPKSITLGVGAGGAQVFNPQHSLTPLYILLTSHS